MQARIGLIATAGLAVLIAATAFAANRKDIERAKNTRQIAECVRCDLSGADLRHGFFQLANMIGANLANAQFDGANMAGVQLMNANLSRRGFHQRLVQLGLARRCQARGCELHQRPHDRRAITGRRFVPGDRPHAKSAALCLR